MDPTGNEAPPRSLPQAAFWPLKLPIPTRVPLLYVILGVLLALSVVPMYFYSGADRGGSIATASRRMRCSCKYSDRSLADDISQHQETLSDDAGKSRVIDSSDDRQ